jgi:hypothetical protein
MEQKMAFFFGAIMMAVHFGYVWWAEISLLI